MKDFIYIIAIFAVLMWRECIHASRQAYLINEYEQRIEQAIQDTSDDTLAACEQRIDEIMAQF